MIMDWECATAIAQDLIKFSSVETAETDTFAGVEQLKPKIAVEEICKRSYQMTEMYV